MLSLRSFRIGLIRIGKGLFCFKTDHCIQLRVQSFDPCHGLFNKLPTRYLACF
jgi:hypothetical protein